MEKNFTKYSNEMIPGLESPSREEREIAARCGRLNKLPHSLEEKIRKWTIVLHGNIRPNVKFRELKFYF